MMVCFAGDNQANSLRVVYPRKAQSSAASTGKGDVLVFFLTEICYD
jgi:hypothetical protein